MANLCQPIDDLGDFLSELSLDVGDCDGRVFHYIMDQSACDSDRVELQVCKNSRDFDTVRYVLLTGQALLAEVRALAETVGAQKRLVIEALRKRLTIVVPARYDSVRFNYG